MFFKGWTRAASRVLRRKAPSRQSTNVGGGSRPTTTAKIAIETSAPASPHTMGRLQRQLPVTGVSESAPSATERAQLSGHTAQGRQAGPKPLIQNGNA